MEVTEAASISPEVLLSNELRSVAEVVVSVKTTVSFPRPLISGDE